jgi:hypothetical protein
VLSQDRHERLSFGYWRELTPKSGFQNKSELFADFHKRLNREIDMRRAHLRADARVALRHDRAHAFPVETSHFRVPG